VKLTHVLYLIVGLIVALTLIAFGYSSARKRHLIAEADALSRECGNSIHISDDYFWPTPVESVPVIFLKANDGSLHLYLRNRVTLAQAKDHFNETAKRLHDIGVDTVFVWMFTETAEGVIAREIDTYNDVNDMARKNYDFK
jgi:hypothetical protein